MSKTTTEDVVSESNSLDAYHYENLWQGELKNSKRLREQLTRSKSRVKELNKKLDLIKSSL